MSDTKSSTPSIMEISAATSAAAKKRYTDAYRIARVIVTAGTALKIVGAVSGVLFWIFISSIGIFAFGDPGDPRSVQVVVMFVITGIVLGCLVFIIFFVWGIVVSANGQHLKAALDHAVHTSPFLSHEQKAAVMSLPIKVY